MSRPLFFADQNFHGDIVSGLLRREPVFPLTQAREIGMEKAKDEEILEHAARTGAIVLSHDFKTMIGFAFERIRAAHPMAGLFMVDQDANIKKVIDDLLLIWACSEAEEWINRVVYLPLKSAQS